MAERKTIIVLTDDRLWKSFLRDLWTVVVLGGLTMLGWWVGSSALQWIGGFLAVLFIMGKVTGVVAKSRFTISEARIELDRLQEGDA